MTAALTLTELLDWSDESTRKWLVFLAEHPELQTAPCGIYKTENVLGLVRHIVAVELRYSQRLAGLPVSAYDEIRADSLAAMEARHAEAIERLRAVAEDTIQNWDEELEFVTLSAGTLRATRRKVFAHALLHPVRHWAQLATLVRAAGTPADFGGDLLLSSALR
ncbi:MAG TPA: DinB family protein [Terracidiphilus sp.]|nr:DinB family protein [Terracidiphilus sp.]